MGAQLAQMTVLVDFAELWTSALMVKVWELMDMEKVYARLEDECTKQDILDLRMFISFNSPRKQYKSKVQVAACKMRRTLYVFDYLAIACCGLSWGSLYGRPTRSCRLRRHFARRGSLNQWQLSLEARSDSGSFTKL